MNETNLNVYYTVQTIPQNLIKLMNCWNSSRSPTSTVLFLELVCFFLEVLRVKLALGIEDGDAVEGSALGDGVVTTGWCVPWGGGNQILFCGCRWTDGAAIVGEVVPVDGVRFRIVGKLLMLKDGCRMRRPLLWDWYLSKDDGLGGGREWRDGVVVGNNCLSRWLPIPELQWAGIDLMAFHGPVLSPDLPLLLDEGSWCKHHQGLSWPLTILTFPPVTFSQDT